MLLILGWMGIGSSWALWKFHLQPTIVKPWRTPKSSFVKLNVYGDVRSILFNISLWSKWLNQLELCHLVWLILYNRIHSRNERIRCSYEKIEQIEYPSVPFGFYFLFINNFCSICWNKIIFNRTEGRALAFFQYLLTLTYPNNKNRQ